MQHHVSQVHKQTHRRAGDKRLCYGTCKTQTHTLSCIHTVHVRLSITKSSNHPNTLTHTRSFRYSLPLSVEVVELTGVLALQTSISILFNQDII